ncbi:hypothetical protein V1515DRAFT_580362 [Lipomyces mesembrius]
MPKLVANANSAIWCWRKLSDPGSPPGTKPVLDLTDCPPCLPYSKRLTTDDYARSSGTTLPVTEIAAKHLASVKEEMGVSGDITSIYGVLQDAAGLFIEKK